jgi:hypothetical protein
LLLKLVIFAVIDTAKVNTSALQSHALKLLVAAYRVIDSDLSDALDARNDFRLAFDSIIRGATEQLRRMAIAGNRGEFENAARNLLRSKFAEKEAKDLLESLYSNRGELDASVQGVLTDLLGLGNETRPPTPNFQVGPVASVQSIQLASSLIRSWSAAGDSPHAKEAFDELQSVLRTFFEIQLKGAPGEITEFNLLVHELAQAHGEKPQKVRLIRPRVEMSDGPVTSILIKALVEPV